MRQGENHVVLENLRDTYPDLVTWTRGGEPVTVRNGQLTYERRDVSVTLEDPIDSLPLGCGRKLNLAIGAAEALQLIGGVSDPALLMRITPRFGSFADASAFHGAYGPRLRDQLQRVPQQLAADPSTRQAVVTIWDANYDQTIPIPRDVPCTVFLQFIFRNQKLELHTHMRSNDVFLGVSYDFFQFTQLQLTMAKLLGVEAGPYHHHATSFHLYARDLGKIDLLTEPTLRERPADLPTGFDGESWPAIQERARYLLDVATGRITEGISPSSFSPSEKWYLEQLRPYWVAPS